MDLALVVAIVAVALNVTVLGPALRSGASQSRTVGAPGHIRTGERALRAVAAAIICERAMRTICIAMICIRSITMGAGAIHCAMIGMRIITMVISAVSFMAPIGATVL